ncbi:hypothetical protein Q3G72_023122 [Acer saccharum]|nr:hypothetical protein Q3G72_023122 [Acer saccharum]
MLQFHHGLAPPSADLRGHWNRCSFDPAACNANQIDVLQGFRNDMLAALHSRLDGMFVNSCFAHCQSESQDTWFAELRMILQEYMIRPLQKQLVIGTITEG